MKSANTSQVTMKISFRGVSFKTVVFCCGIWCTSYIFYKCSVIFWKLKSLW